MTDQVQGLPPGVTLDAQPHDAAPSTSGLPPGVTLDAQPHDAAPAQQTTAPEVGPVTKAANQIAAGATDIGTGFAKGVEDTTAGIGGLIQKIPGIGPKIIPQSGLAAEEQQAKIDQNAPGHVGQDVGKGLENATEFASGDVALDGLAKFAKIAKYAPDLVNMLEKFPTSAKIILNEIGKGATIGSAQAAVKGAGTPEGAVKSAEGGAVGGAIGGAVAGGVSAFLGNFIKSPVESLERAAGGSRTVNNTRFTEDVQTALPKLIDENRVTPIKNPEGMATAAENAKAKVWDNYKTMTDNPKYTNETISGDDIAQKIKDSVDPNIRQHNAAEAKMINKWADTFKGNMFLPAAREKITFLNKQLASFYKVSPGEQAILAARNPSLGMLDSAADAVRDSLDAKLTSLGEIGAKDLRNQYGALNNVQKVFEKRAIVYGRQAPMSLGEQVGNIAAVTSGNPTPVAVAAAGKHLNSPGHLIRSAMSQANPGAIRAGATAVAGAAKTATEAGGVAAGQEVSQPKAPSGTPIAENTDNWIKVKASNGKNYRVHPDDHEEMKQRDPGLQAV